MHEPFDALFELNEGAVRHDVDDVRLVLRADGVALFDALPRRHGLLLQTERDALAVAVDAEDLDLDLLVQGDHL